MFDVVGIEAFYACAVIYMFGEEGGGGEFILLLKWLVCLSCLMLMWVGGCLCVCGGGETK